MSLVTPNILSCLPFSANIYLSTIETLEKCVKSVQGS